MEQGVSLADGLCTSLGGSLAGALPCENTRSFFLMQLPASHFLQDVCKPMI